MTDYYIVIGVLRNASLAEIKTAYRKRALECHPDCGGSHEEMLQINEAYEILSSANLRADYDRVFTGDASNETIRRTQEATRQAQEKAADYPQDWESFETWINWFTSDAAEAEYGELKLPFGDMVIATAGKSVSGWLFILGGIAIGMMIMMPIAHSKNPSPGITFQKLCGAGLAIMFGSMLGAAAHSYLAKTLKEKNLFQNPPSPPPRNARQFHNATTHQSTPSSQSKPPVTIHACPNCQQKVRIPKVPGKVNIMCPKCRSSFVT